MKASLELQKAIRTKLAGLGHKVFDYLPNKNTTYPFVVIGEDRQSDGSVKNADEVTVNTTISVFSTYKGQMEVKTVLEAIRSNCLDLELDSYRIQSARVTDSFTTDDTENKCIMGIIEINYTLLRG